MTSICLTTPAKQPCLLIRLPDSNEAFIQMKLIRHDRITTYEQYITAQMKSKHIIYRPFVDQRNIAEADGSKSM